MDSYYEEEEKRGAEEGNRKLQVMVRMWSNWNPCALLVGL